jgi:hypothetical protein
LDKARALVAYWRDKYDWRRFEARANTFPQFRTRIDGLGIHFLHVRSQHPKALPIILTHGWPGSFVEFMEIIGPLSDPTRFGGRAKAMSSCRRSRVSRFPTSRQKRVGTWSESRTPGPR